MNRGDKRESYIRDPSNEQGRQEKVGIERGREREGEEERGA